MNTKNAPYGMNWRIFYLFILVWRLNFKPDFQNALKGGYHGGDQIGQPGEHSGFIYRLS